MNDFDWGTASVIGNDVVDTHKTGFPYYDEFLRGGSTEKHLRNEKNLEGKIVMMSPQEYFELCSDYGFPGSHPSVDNLKLTRRRDKEIIDYLKSVLTIQKKKFPLPYINKAENGQEGLHRMMAIGDLLGWNFKVPVLVVDWADKERASRDAENKRIRNIESKIQSAVYNSLHYKFANIDELKEQLQWDLDRAFEHNGLDVDIPVKFELTSDEQNKEFKVSIGSAEYSFSYDSVNFVEPSKEQEDDLDDLLLDPEETEEFLVTYFGDNWRETHPHLKSLLKI